MPLYRRQEKNAQLMDFKCVEFVEELLYGQWRKKPLAKVGQEGRCERRERQEGMRNRILFVTARWQSLARSGSVAPVRLAGQAKSPVPRAPDGHPDLSGHVRFGDADAARAAGGAACGSVGRGSGKTGEEHRRSRESSEAAPFAAIGRPRPKAVTARSVLRGTSAATTRSGSTAERTTASVNGQKRSSIVIDPPDGKVPSAHPGGASACAEILSARPTSDAGESNRDPGLEPPGSYDDPERRPLGERCLLGFGSTSGPPVLPNYFYNNLHQIVQTADSIMILTEMVHDARIVRMNAQHLPPTIRKWMGDSVGHWEGDTLVVDTTNFTDQDTVSRIDRKPARGGTFHARRWPIA